MINDRADYHSPCAIDTCAFCRDRTSPAVAQFVGTECGKGSCDRHLLNLVVEDFNVLCGKLAELRDDHDAVENRVESNESDIVSLQAGITGFGDD